MDDLIARLKRAADAAASTGNSALLREAADALESLQPAPEPQLEVFIDKPVNFFTDEQKERGRELVRQWDTGESDNETMGHRMRDWIASVCGEDE